MRLRNCVPLLFLAIVSVASAQKPFELEVTIKKIDARGGTITLERNDTIREFPVSSRATVRVANRGATLSDLAAGMKATIVYDPVSKSVTSIIVAASKPTRRTDYGGLALNTWVRVLDGIPAPQYDQDGNLLFDGVTFPLSRNTFGLPNNRSEKDVIIRARVKRGESEKVGFEIQCHADDGSHHKCRGFVSHTNYVYIGRSVGGKNTALQSLPISRCGFPSLPMDSDGFTELALAAIGDRLILYLDGKKVIEVSDTAYAGHLRKANLTCSRTGIAADAKASEFRDVEIMFNPTDASFVPSAGADVVDTTAVENLPVIRSTGPATPVRINSHDPRDRRNPSISRDGLSLVFTKWSDEANAWTAWLATRPTVDVDFGSATHLCNGWGTTIDESGLELIRYDHTSDRLLWSTRKSRHDSFGKPTPTPCFEEGDIFGPFLSADGRQLWFHWENDIWVSERKARGTAWPSPKKVELPALGFRSVSCPSVVPDTKELLLTGVTDDERHYALVMEGDSQTWRIRGRLVFDGFVGTVNEVRYCPATSEVYFARVGLAHEIWKAPFKGVFDAR